ncbi:MAG TPA: CHAD domain-containing protein [Chthoniobacterales bacterium]|nr:CHAD domain-containing protein [Chthoniobacterales bacterium]
MSYELRPDEALADGIRRICQAEICKAIEVANGSRQTDDSPVHEIRKHLKKARAALRLVRKEIGRSAFRQQDHWLRDAGRLVSEVRDAEVRLSTVRQLQSIKPRRRRAPYPRLEQMLALELENFLAAFAEWQNQTLPLLQQARAATDRWTVAHFDARQLGRIIQKSYKCARSSLRAARKNPSPECFHEFRADAKLLLYQLRILRPINPVVLKNLADELKAVGELLGRAHDLTFLGDRLRRDEGHSAWHREGQKLLAVLEVSQSDLHRAAADLAERFFAERPRDFGARIDVWLNEWIATKSDSVAEALVN